MRWIAEVHAKVQILQAQVELARSMAREFGMDESEAISPFLREIERIHESELPLARAMDQSETSADGASVGVRDNLGCRR